MFTNYVFLHKMNRFDLNLSQLFENFALWMRWDIFYFGSTVNFLNDGDYDANICL